VGNRARFSKKIASIQASQHFVFEKPLEDSFLLGMLGKESCAIKFDLLEPHLERWRIREAPLFGRLVALAILRKELRPWVELQMIDCLVCIANAPEGVIRLCSCWRVAEVVAACGSSYLILQWWKRDCGSQGLRGLGEGGQPESLHSSLGH
jgi:hypothetical protein